MSKRRTLSDLYRFPGCKPKKAVKGVFGDPRARVIKLERRGKKQYVAYAELAIGRSMTAKVVWSAPSPAATPASTWNWTSGASSAGGAAR